MVPGGRHHCIQNHQRSGQRIPPQVIYATLDTKTLCLPEEAPLLVNIGGWPPPGFRQPSVVSEKNGGKKNVKAEWGSRSSHNRCHVGQNLGMRPCSPNLPTRYQPQPAYPPFLSFPPWCFLELSPKQKTSHNCRLTSCNRGHKLLACQLTDCRFRGAGGLGTFVVAFHVS